MSRRSLVWACFRAGLVLMAGFMMLLLGVLMLLTSITGGVSVCLYHMPWFNEWWLESPLFILSGLVLLDVFIRIASGDG